MGQYPSLRRESGRAAPAANVSGLLPDLSTRPSAAQLPRNPLPDLWDGHGSKWSSQRQGVQRTQTPMLSGKGPDTCAKDLSPQEGRRKPLPVHEGSNVFPGMIRLLGPSRGLSVTQ